MMNAMKYTGWNTHEPHTTASRTAASTAWPPRATRPPRRMRSGALGGHELDQRAMRDIARAVRSVHREHHGKASGGPCRGVGREGEREPPGNVEHEGRDRAERRRQRRTRRKTARQRTGAHERRLGHEHDRHRAAPHAAQLVEGELALAPAQQEPIGIPHQEEEHEHREDGERLQDVARTSQHAQLLGREPHGLQMIRRGNERIQQACSEAERREIDRVIARAAVHVADGESEIQKAWGSFRLRAASSIERTPMPSHRFPLQVTNNVVRNTE